MGQSAPSTILQMVQIWEEWLSHQIVVLPSEGPWQSEQVDQLVPHEIQQSEMPNARVE